MTGRGEHYYDLNDLIQVSLLFFKTKVCLNNKFPSVLLRITIQMFIYTEEDFT